MPFTRKTDPIPHGNKFTKMGQTDIVAYVILCAVRIIYMKEWIVRINNSMKTLSSSKVHYIDGKSKTAPKLLAEQLGQLMSVICSPGIQPVFVCIGSDRVTGDSLGPLVGTKLQYTDGFSLPVYGTLDFPIHALNLKDAMRSIKYFHPRNPIIAIDASLGTKRHQHYITISTGSLCPGSGVDKKLMEVGDISITGIINTSGEFAQLILQTTRLSAVMALADCICEGILMACKDTVRKDTKPIL